MEPADKQNYLLQYKESMDNQSNQSEQEIEVSSELLKKPSNRNTFSHKGLKISSSFPGGNLQAASFQEQYRMEGKTALVIEFWGNSDAQKDPLDKCWFYFRVTGINANPSMKYQEIIFRFKNANNLRKFIREKKFKPYVVFKENNEQGESPWAALFVSKINILQNEVIEAEFVYNTSPDVNSATFAENLPYNINDLENLHLRCAAQLRQSRNSKIYYHREIIAESVDEYPIYMLTITSCLNIVSYEQSQPQLWGYLSQRPFALKNRPEIVITSRVHPSETSSSFCMEGIIEQLVTNPEMAILLNLFIFRIVPLMNPDGVENGHYRLDNYLQNLNRFYGHSDPVKTPPVHAVEKLLVHLRDKGKLFTFIDIHGHNSPKPSFIFGNYSQNFYQTLENRTFVKVLQLLSDGNFDSLGCEFSKKHMTVKQKYDEHSKQASARVFAYRGNSQEENTNNCKQGAFVEHSYTLQVHPYVISNPNIRKSFTRKPNRQTSSSFKNLAKAGATLRKFDPSMVPCEPMGAEIVEQYKKIGQHVLISILEIIGMNGICKIHESINVNTLRRKNYKDIGTMVEHYDKFKRTNSKLINKEMVQRYCHKWGLMEGYHQYLTCQLPGTGHEKQSYKDLPIFQVYVEWLAKKEKIDEANAKRIKQANLLQKGRIKEKAYVRLETYTQDVWSKQFEEEGSSKYDIKSQKYTLLSFPNPAQRLSREIEDAKNSSALKSIEFEMVDKPNGARKNMITKLGPRLNGSSMSPNKGIPLMKNSDMEQLQRKIRGLLFRHKTQSEINQQSKLGCLRPNFEISEEHFSLNCHKHSKLDHIRELEKNYINNKLEPLSKQKKARASQLCTEEAKMQEKEVDFNDKLINPRNQERPNQSQIRRIQMNEALNPRIQQFMKKVNMRRNEQLLSNNDQISIRSSNIISNRKTSSSRAMQQRMDEHSGVEPARQNIIFHSSIVLPPMQTLTPEQPGEMSRQRAALKTIRSKTKKTETIADASLSKPTSKQMDQIVKSFRTIAGEASSRIQFIQRAKRMLSEKRRDGKNAEEPVLPTIAQIEMSADPRRKKW